MSSGESALRNALLLGLAQLSTASYCGHEDDGGSGADVGTPHRVGIVVVLVFIVFYSIVVGLILALYRCLRSGPAEAFAEKQAQGKIVESECEEEIADASVGWITLPLEEVHKLAGLDAVLYLTHVKHMATYCGAQFLVMGVVLCATYHWGGDYEGPNAERSDWMLDTDQVDKDGLYMWGWSYANFAGPADPTRDNSSKRFIAVFGAYWAIASTCIFALKKQKAMDVFKHDTNESESHASKFTLWIDHVSIRATEESLTEYFEKHFPAQVKSIKLVQDVNALGHNVRTQRRIIIRANNKIDSLEEDPSNAAKVQEYVAKAKAEVKLLKEAEPQLRGAVGGLVGTMFVTFKSPDFAQGFRKQLSSEGAPNETTLHTDRWTAQMAPRPAEIYWENFGLSAETKSKNYMRSMGLTLLMYIMFVIISMGAVWFIGFEYMYYLYYMPAKDWVMADLCPMKDSVGNFLWYGVFALSFVIAFLVLEEEMAPVIKFITKYEMPLTKSLKQSAYLGKCYWFYVIYHMVLSTTILGWLADNVKVDPTFFINESQGVIKLYVEAIGAFHQHRVFLTVGIIDMIHVLEGSSFFTRVNHTLTEEEEEEFKSAEDEEEADAEYKNSKDKFYNDKFDFSRNYGETIGVFTSVCYYQVMHPSILICGVCYYGAKYYMDKYQICNQYSKGHIQYGRRARTTTTYILFSMAIGQMGNCVYYLLLTDDIAVGMCMLLGLIAATTVLCLHTFQPEGLKKKKTATRADNKLESIGERKSIDEEMEVEDERFDYQPPTPETLVVDMEFKEVGSTKTSDDAADSTVDAATGMRNFNNPMQDPE